MKRAIGIAALAGVCACAITPQTMPGAVAGVPPGITYEGGDGLNCETRVVIKGTTHTMEGIRAEKSWLRARYPGHRFGGQVLTACEGRPADKLLVTTADGKELAIYFDISEFYGKDFE